MSCSKQLAAVVGAVLLLALPLGPARAEDPAKLKEVRLTEDGRLKRDPVFQPDGEHLVYGVDVSTDLIKLLRLNLETKESVPLHSDAPRSELEPSFSANGRYHAYSQNTGNLSLKLVIRDDKEQKNAELVPQGRGGMRSPAFSPDSTLVAYCFAETGPQHIFLVTPQAKEKRQLTTGRGINNWPTFTPDGERIVFSSSRDGDFEVYSINLAGEDLRRLTESPRQDIRPRVSPDGTRIVFASSRNGDQEIYMMDLDGSNLTRLTQNPERDDYPSWNVDGSKVVYVSERRGRFDLYLVDVPR